MFLVKLVFWPLKVILFDFPVFVFSCFSTGEIPAPKPQPKVVSKKTTKTKVVIEIDRGFGTNRITPGSIGFK